MEYQYGNASSPYRQYDMTLANARFYTIPTFSPGRLMADDFVYFSYGINIDPKRYSVVVESSDTAGERWRNIGLLSERVHLPFVQFAPYARVGLVPDDYSLPNFVSTLARGATYIVPVVPKVPTSDGSAYEMQRKGGKF